MDTVPTNSLLDLRGSESFRNGLALQDSISQTSSQALDASLFVRPRNDDVFTYLSICKRRICLMTPSDRFTKEETERVIRGDFKGLADALELMRKRKQGPQVVGRWDWHLWMFLISTCLPCFGVYCLAMWVRSGLWEEHRKRETAKQDSSNKPDPTQQRISALEHELQYLRYLVLLGSPKLTPETVQRMIPGNQSTKEVKEAPSEERSPVQKTSWSDRVWLRIKKWLPFYVEPYYDQKTDHHQNSGLSTVFKSEK